MPRSADAGSASDLNLKLDDSKFGGSKIDSLGSPAVSLPQLSAGLDAKPLASLPSSSFSQTANSDAAIPSDLDLKFDGSSAKISSDPKMTSLPSLSLSEGESNLGDATSAAADAEGAGKFDSASSNFATASSADSANGKLGLDALPPASSVVDTNPVGQAQLVPDAAASDLAAPPALQQQDALGSDALPKLDTSAPVSSLLQEHQHVKPTAALPKTEQAGV